MYGLKAVPFKVSCHARGLLMNSAGDDVRAGCVRLNAGRTQQYLEGGKRTIGLPGPLENGHNRLRVQERFCRCLGCCRIQASEQEEFSITA